MIPPITLAATGRAAAFCSALSVLAIGIGISAADDQTRPNLLFIFPDQWRGQALGFLDHESVITPHLDRFATESLVLTQAVSNYPVCSPYRAMLMTGKYPHANGVLGNCTSKGTEYGYQLRPQDRCWSDVLGDRGYSLGYVGKWHLEAPRKPYVKSYNNSDQFAWNEWTPPDRRHGFRFWYAYNTFDRHLTPEYWATDSKRQDRIRVQQWGPEHEAEMAIRFIRNEDGTYRQNDQPFALVVAMNPPHMPYNQVPQRYVDRYQGRTAERLLRDRPDLLPADDRWGKYTRKNLVYQYAMMTGVDEQVGRILRVLEDEHLAGDTIVVFTSDHGDCLGLHGMVSKNNHYELSMRVPLIIRWPGRIQPGRDDLLISSPDFYPTLLELMGLSANVPQDVQGTSYARLLVGQQMKRPTSQLYLKVPHGHPELGRRGVRTHRYTLMVERQEGEAPQRIELYDNRQDPFQMKNLAAEQPDVVKRLVREQLTPWLRQTGDPWR